VSPAAAGGVLPGASTPHQGEMDWIYAHLMAQDNFLRLLARRGMFAQRAAA
jgi:hypothetical protein